MKSGPEWLKHNTGEIVNRPLLVLKQPNLSPAQRKHIGQRAKATIMAQRFAASLAQEDFMSHWCSAHPRYSAKREPKALCGRCWELYRYKNPELPSKKNLPTATRKNPSFR